MATTMSGHSEPNPYVGPRSIQHGEPLHGRREEVQALFCELQARRIVVLHSPSGAGKSSLVQAGLIPRLHEGRFDVWRPIRVNLDPTGLVGVPEGANRYLLSVMSSLEEELPAGNRRGPAELAGSSLAEYLRTRPRRRKQQGRPVVLLFDQFEEVLTVAPRAVDAKRAFFTELGQALADEHYWALLIVREDFLAAFAPYRDRLPTRMANTFRLDLLGLAGAREAAEQPALAAGRTFPAVDQLVADLSTVQVQQADGTFVAEPGLHVEPVQLQVVCRRLWAAMPPDARSIDEEHLARYASVSESLASYYAQAVQDVAQGDVAVERTIREWVGHELVVGGIRSQVRQGAGHSGGLDNTLIEALLQTYLVRTEQRAGSSWYELSHDRLVEPIQRDNERWEHAHLHPLQVRAKLWEQGHRASALLLGAEALEEAEPWVRESTALLTEGEHEFLRQSHALHAEEARRRRRQKQVNVLIAATAVVVAALALWALTERSVARDSAQQAEEARRVAREQAERARAASLLAGTGELLRTNSGASAALLLAEAERPEAMREWVPAANEVLLRELPRSRLTHPGGVYSAEWSPDGTRILTASADQTAKIWNADGSGDPIVLAGHEARVVSARWSPDGARILTASTDGTARVWSASGTSERVLRADGPLNSAEWSPSAAHIVTASANGTVQQWPAALAGEPSTVSTGGGAWTTAAFSPRGSHVVTSGSTVRLSPNGRILLEDDVRTTVWSPDESLRAELSPEETSVRISTADGRLHAILTGHADRVCSAAWSPDGARIATTSKDMTLRIWSADGKGEPVVLRHHTTAVLSAVWSPDGARIVSVSRGSTPRLWNADGSGGGPVLLQGHEGLVSSVRWSPDGTRVVTASTDDDTARVWELQGPDRLVLLHHEHPVRSAAWNASGTRVLTTDGRVAQVWDGRNAAKPVALPPGTGSIVAHWSPDGDRVAAASPEGTAWIWSSREADEPLVRLDVGSPVGWVEWSPRGDRILTASADGIVRSWSADGSGEPFAIAHHSDPVQFAAFLDDRSIITRSEGVVRSWRADGSGAPVVLAGLTAPISFVAVSPDRTHVLAIDELEVRVWRIGGSAEPLVLAHQSSVELAEWSPDGSHVFTAAGDRIGRVWDMEGNGRPIPLPQRGTISSAGWSPAGTHLALTAGDTTLIIGVAEGGELLMFRNRGTALHSLAAWSPDGSRIFTASEDGVVYIRVIELDVAELRRAIGEVTTDCLDVELRMTYLAETETLARERYEACERSHGRTPVATP